MCTSQHFVDVSTKQGRQFWEVHFDIRELILNRLVIRMKCCRVDARPVAVLKPRFFPVSSTSKRFCLTLSATQSARVKVQSKRKKGYRSEVCSLYNIDGLCTQNDANSPNSSRLAAFIRLQIFFAAIPSSVCNMSLLSSSKIISKLMTTQTHRSITFSL